MMDGPTRAALRALRDLRVVRAPWNHPGYSRLLYLRLAHGRATGGIDWDYRLTPRGVEAAKELKP